MDDSKKQAIKDAAKEILPVPPTPTQTDSPPKMRYAVVGPSGQVKIE
jgi:hypothetical protein